jgi:hypothetical protein
MPVDNMIYTLKVITQYACFLERSFPFLLGDIHLKFMRAMWFEFSGTLPHFSHQVCNWFNHHFSDAWIGCGLGDYPIWALSQWLKLKCPIISYATSVGTLCAMLVACPCRTVSRCVAFLQGTQFCPSTNLELAVEYGPGWQPVRPGWLYSFYAGLCAPARSMPSLGFYSRQLCFELPVWFLLGSALFVR